MIIHNSVAPAAIDPSAHVAKGRFRSIGVDTIVVSRVNFIEMISEESGSLLCQPVFSNVQQLCTYPCIGSDLDSGDVSLYQDINEIYKLTFLLMHAGL